MKTRDRKKGSPELRSLTRAWSIMSPELRALSRTILSFPETRKSRASAAHIAAMYRLRLEEARKVAKGKVGSSSVS